MTPNGLDSSEAFVLLDDNLAPEGRALLFEKPVEILRCDRPQDAPATLKRMADLTAGGYHLAGYFAYELGYLFEPRLAGLIEDRLEKTRGTTPLIWMAAFHAPRSLDSEALAKILAPAGRYETSTPELSLTREDYIVKVGKVRDYIAAGDVYQINFTFKYNFRFSGDPTAFYRNLRCKQPVSYGALIHDPAHGGSDPESRGFDLLSLSPELFFRREGDRVWTRPMKGTAARGLDSAGDAEQAAWLRNDEKSRAENLMIVDLLRNDIGRVAETGSVEVTDLFTVETYRTVLQMTSGITAKLQDGVSFRDIIQKIFPCGSITGAPKVRAMEIIHELEPEARGVYTGAIGMIGPDGDCRFNVAIRTLMIEAAPIDTANDGAQETVRKAEMGIGSGIVYDSNPADEYDECLLKGQFLTTAMEDFELIETMIWRPESGYHLLDYHLERLEDSARYFGFRHDAEAVERALKETARPLTDGRYRVRLLLDRQGDISITSTALAPPDRDATFRFVISEHRIDSRDPFFRHKTTRRQLYDREYARWHEATGCDEVLFLNERDELAEGSRTNVFLEHDGMLVTPPLSSGALPGTLRRALIEDEPRVATEAVLTLKDLKGAMRVLFGNSVRGLQQAKQLDTSTANKTSDNTTLKAG
ncbi:aminodeoxychorismate synthase component I [Denitrobaculum tricleocarpae]|uniref:Probable branched-chain-amino-acid aminotransferase n=2 Tax=Denitrobaculum tricleocarpae TaxID=2591009 RepID=A0A545TL96_9PROT|nr:aminodeoxychorismate synthase component I [Denitrobaculum tricleocarpae]